MLVPVPQSPKFGTSRISQFAALKWKLFAVKDASGSEKSTQLPFVGVIGRLKSWLLAVLRTTDRFVALGVETCMRPRTMMRLTWLAVKGGVPVMVTPVPR